MQSTCLDVLDVFDVGCWCVGSNQRGINQSLCVPPSLPRYKLVTPGTLSYVHDIIEQGNVVIPKKVCIVRIDASLPCLPHRESRHLGPPVVHFEVRIPQRHTAN